MPNYNPKIENLTRAGKGRPKLNKKRITIAISPECLEILDRYCEGNKVNRNDAIEEWLKSHDK